MEIMRRLDKFDDSELNHLREALPGEDDRSVGEYSLEDAVLVDDNEYGLCNDEDDYYMSARPQTAANDPQLTASAIKSYFEKDGIVSE